MTTLYKVTAENGVPYHGGSGAWPLPKDGEPGEWRTVSGKVEPCRRGLHLVTLEQLPHWLGPVIWEAEFHPDAEIVKQPDKLVGSKARLIRRVETWNERTARLFSADCAEHVLPLFEKHYPNDDRPRKAIEAARAFANGEITREQLAAAQAAARDAAWDAARDAAWAAAWDAAQAARDAAWDAAWDAARDAEIRWQGERLGEYLRGER